MASSFENRILIAVDGSANSLEAVRYVAQTVQGDRCQVVLFHIMANVPESFFDSERISAYHYKLIDTGEWERLQRENVQNFMQKAKQILLESGYPAESVFTNVQIRKVGIARDLIEESRNGYMSVVVGRQGASQLRDIVLGSTAHKLVEKVSNLPVWIAASGAQNKRILVALDASQGAMFAVDHVGRVLGGSADASVLLLHAIQSDDLFSRSLGESVVPAVEKEWFDGLGRSREANVRGMGQVLETAVSKLQEAGLGIGRVSTKIIRNAGSLAGAVVEEAKAGDYDTIVVGRRGLSRVQEFFMGRISSKVIQLAKNKTIWVVS